MEKLRLRQLYQPLAEPVTAAIEAAKDRSASARNLRLIMDDLLGSNGDYGTADRIPLLGDVQEL